jgi:hypothetical protein
MKDRGVFHIPFVDCLVFADNHPVDIVHTPLVDHMMTVENSSTAGQKPPETVGIPSIAPHSPSIDPACPLSALGTVTMFDSSPVHLLVHTVHRMIFKKLSPVTEQYVFPLLFVAAPRLFRRQL